MIEPVKVFVASDHAGFPLKDFLLKNVKEVEFVDLGPSNTDRVDYPDFANKVAEKVDAGEGIGLLICGSGQGMAMRANKFKNVRAALVWDKTSTRLSREHNNANILCLGARLIPFGLAKEMLDVFFKTGFAGGRHAGRVEKISS